MGLGTAETADEIIALDINAPKNKYSSETISEGVDISGAPTPDYSESDSDAV